MKFLSTLSSSSFVSLIVAYITPRRQKGQSSVTAVSVATALSHSQEWRIIASGPFSLGSRPNPNLPFSCPGQPTLFRVLTVIEASVERALDRRASLRMMNVTRRWPLHYFSRRNALSRVTALLPEGYRARTSLFRVSSRSALLHALLSDRSPLCRLVYYRDVAPTEICLWT